MCESLRTLSGSLLPTDIVPNMNWCTRTEKKCDGNFNFKMQESTLKHRPTRVLLVLVRQVEIIGKVSIDLDVIAVLIEFVFTFYI